MANFELAPRKPLQLPWICGAEAPYSILITQTPPVQNTVMQSQAEGEQTDN